MTMLALFVVACLWWIHRQEPPASARAAGPAASPRPARESVRVSHNAVSPPALTGASNRDTRSRLTYATAWNDPASAPFARFRSWVVRYQTADPSNRAALEAEGIALARARRPEMRALIATDPERALATTVPARVRALLPSAVAAEIETRVSGTGDYELIAGTPAPGDARRGPPLRRVVVLQGESYEAHVYGRRLDQLTKFHASLHGIALDGALALHENPLRVLEPDESAAASEPTCPVSGDPVATVPAGAAAATEKVSAFGRIWEFCGHGGNMLETFEARLIADESQSGPEVRGFGLNADSATAATPPTAADAGTAWTTGTKQILMIRVDFSDLPGEPVSLTNGVSTILTPQAVLDWMNNTVAPMYQNMSYGKTTLVTTVSSKVYRLPALAAYYALGRDFELHSDARSAASADFDLKTYDRIVVVFSSLANLSPPSYSWGGYALINGPYVWINGVLGSIAHEIGHTYGLVHANLWRVTDANPISDGGSSVEYGDPFDTMGGPLQLGDVRAHFNPWYKNQLGWLPDAQVQTLSTNGTYRLYRFDHPSATNTLAFKIVRDSTTNYWIGLRRLFTDNSSLSHGLYIIKGYNRVQQSDLLDLVTPGTSTADAALPLGGTFSDPVAQITLKPIAEGGTAPFEYMDVQVTFGPTPPAINASPKSQYVLAGQLTTFSVSASGLPPPGYVWQRRPRGATDWSSLADDRNYSGTRTPRLTVQTSADMDGDQFQCLVDNGSGRVSSATATLTVAASGVFTLAGSGSADHGDGISGAASFFNPSGIAIDPAGYIYTGDAASGLIRRISPTGVVVTVAGNAGQRGVVDGTGTDARLWDPRVTAVDRSGTLYFCDYTQHVVRKMSADGVVTTLAGAPGRSGSTDGPAANARFFFPRTAVADSAGDVFVADSANNVIRVITPDGMVSTFAGQAGNSGEVDGTGSAALIYYPMGLTIDANDNLYVAEYLSGLIRKITPAAVVTTVARGLGHPTAIAVDHGGNLYVTDSTAHAIRKVTATGVVTTLAGPGSGYVDGPLATARFNAPDGIAVDSANNLIIADSGNNRVRLITSGLPASVSVQADKASVFAGGTATFSVTLANASAYTYQWLRNGATIPGATSSTFIVSNARASDAGSYSVRVTSAGGSITSDSAPLIVTAPSRISNLSIRSTAGSGSDTLIVGFTIGGAGTTGLKPLLIRGVGPTLGNFGVAGALADPKLEIYNGSTKMLENDNWSGVLQVASVASQVGAFALASSSSRDAALYFPNFTSGSYSAQVTGVGGTSGIALAEIYDTTADATSGSTTPRLINVSARTTSTAGAGVLITGFAISGAAPKTVLLRAIGPTLAGFGVSGVLADPRLELYRDSTKIAENDDWSGASALASAFTAVGAFPLNAAAKDAALLISLAPGSYTAQVIGNGGTTGIVLVELYEVP